MERVLDDIIQHSQDLRRIDPQERLVVKGVRDAHMFARAHDKGVLQALEDQSIDRHRFARERRLGVHRHDIVEHGGDGAHGFSNLRFEAV